MEKKTYIMPTTTRIALKMFQGLMEDIDYGDPDVTSTEDLIINARQGDYEEEMETDSSLPVYHSLWDEEE